MTVWKYLEKTEKVRVLSNNVAELVECFTYKITTLQVIKTHLSLHMTMKGQGCDLNILRAKYLEKARR